MTYIIAAIAAAALVWLLRLLWVEPSSGSGKIFWRKAGTKLRGAHHEQKMGF